MAMTSTWAGPSSNGLATSPPKRGTPVASEAITPRRASKRETSVASEAVTPRRASKRGTPVASETVTPRRALKRGTSVATEAVTPQRALTPLPAVKESSQLRFDLLRLRVWFNLRDKEQYGYITKRHFMAFLRNQPQLQALLVDCSAPQLNSRPREAAVRWRRQSATWQEFSCGKEHLEWDQFVDFFRRLGWLLDYKIKDNPRDRLAEMLADIHTRPSEQDWQTLDEFVELRKRHLQGQQKQQLGITVGLDMPWALEAACLAISKPSSPICSTRAPSSRCSSINSSRPQSFSVPCGVRFSRRIVTPRLLNA